MYIIVYNYTMFPHLPLASLLLSLQFMYLISKLFDWVQVLVSAFYCLTYYFELEHPVIKDISCLHQKCFLPAIYDLPPCGINLNLIYIHCFLLCSFSIIEIWIYLLFYIAFNSQGHIATGSFTGGGNQCILHCKPPASASNYHFPA